MPISKQEFEKSQKPLYDRILSFLQENNDKAYNEIEIYSAVMGYSEYSLAIVMLAASPDKLSTLLGPLRKEMKILLEDGKIRSALHQGQAYYSISEK